MIKRYRSPLTLFLLGVGFSFILLISRVQQWDALVWATLFFLCVDVQEDVAERQWLRFLPLGIPMLAILYLIFRNAADVWWRVAEWQLTRVGHLFQWDALFRRIPLNDPSYLWAPIESSLFTKFMKWVYSYGFAFSALAAVIRSFLARDWRKMLRYALATHILQTPLIMPFYNTIMLHEVWWVVGRLDPFQRSETLTPFQVEVAAQNAFPSMHTSVAFAVMLLALREKGPVFKWGMVAYTAAIIFSTMYLDIHWVLDVVGGMLFGWGVVKLTDLLLRRVFSEPKASPSPAPVETVSAAD